MFRHLKSEFVVQSGAQQKNLVVSELPVSYMCKKRETETDSWVNHNKCMPSWCWDELNNPDLFLIFKTNTSKYELFQLTDTRHINDVILED